ncbi:DNRLRE domain-containing protein [Clostridium sp. UBA7339]|uniref:DNRLRE domain-containing protein n=2 Tax=Clostridium TaxID=1485 RepID=A0A927W1Q5_9CLOT|nr:DNRLRE domain-containing protein [Clostridium sulfidigenes]HBL06331.1 hypothetical protein [Clostridium sp.]
MSNIIIYATKSLTVTSKLINGNMNKPTITVGSDGIHNYISYLFFDISSIPSNASISSAELVLFKTNNFYNDCRKIFSIYPLCDYFSTYTTFNNRPEVDINIKKNFHPITSDVAITVDLTDFVVLWLQNKLSNRGIALLDRSNSILTQFGSSICKDRYLVPFLKVVINDECKCCKECNCCNKGEGTIRQVNVKGTVAENSKYVAIVNIGVTRSGTGHTDNYYITDEYNNLSNSSPLYVDKIYNMAIVPKENPGDIETVSFYGSYKE